MSAVWDVLQWDNSGNTAWAPGLPIKIYVWKDTQRGCRPLEHISMDVRPKKWKASKNCLSASAKQDKTTVGGIKICKHVRACMSRQASLELLGGYEQILLNSLWLYFRSILVPCSVESKRQEKRCTCACSVWDIQRLKSQV